MMHLVGAHNNAGSSCWFIMDRAADRSVQPAVQSQIRIKFEESLWSLLSWINISDFFKFSW